jgi:hypothetical protein
MSRIGSGLCPIADFGINGVEASGSATRVRKEVGNWQPDQNGKMQLLYANEKQRLLRTACCQ